MKLKSSRYLNCPSKYSFEATIKIPLQLCYFTVKEVKRVVCLFVCAVGGNQLTENTLDTSDATMVKILLDSCLNE